MFGTIFCYVLLVERECIGSAELSQDDCANKMVSCSATSLETWAWEKERDGMVWLSWGNREGMQLGRLARVIVVIDRSSGPWGPRPPRHDGCLHLSQVWPHPDPTGHVFANLQGLAGSRLLTSACRRQPDPQTWGHTLTWRLCWVGTAAPTWCCLHFSLSTLATAKGDQAPQRSRNVHLLHSPWSNSPTNYVTSSVMSLSLWFVNLSKWWLLYYENQITFV